MPDAERRHARRPARPRRRRRARCPASAGRYGQTVNLASRLTALAEPGTLSADGTVRAAAGTVAAWGAAVQHEVRGYDRPIGVHAARPDGVADAC